MTDDLASYLAARYDEIEQVARRAMSPGNPYFQVRGWAWWDADFGECHLFEPHMGDETDVGMPASVLADVEAKRRIVAEYADVADLDDPEEQYDNLIGRAVGLGKAVRLLAQPFAGRDDFRDEWKL
jgi:hypothetical protein